MQKNHAREKKLGCCVVITTSVYNLAQGASNALLYKLLVFTLLQEVSVLPRRFEF